MPPIEVEKRMKQELELATDYISRIEKDIKDKDARIAEVESQARNFYGWDCLGKHNAQIASLEAQLKSARDNALEEAAKLCEEMQVDFERCDVLILTSQAWEEGQVACAEAIRSLKTKGQA